MAVTHFGWRPFEFWDTTPYEFWISFDGFMDKIDAESSGGAILNEDDYARLKKKAAEARKKEIS